MLKQIFKENGFTLNREVLKKFDLFLSIFKEKNNDINLSSIKDDNSIIEKHFVDSLMLTKFIELKGEVADIGTGGGFPLLPLAIYSNYQLKDSGIMYYGIDSVEKKLKVVDGFASDLGISNLETIHTRIEDLGQDKDNRDSFDFVVSRATAYFPTLLEYAISLLKVGGIFIAYKMDNDNELIDGGRALISLKAEIIYVKRYVLDGQKRCLVFVRKNEKTPKIYPRSPQMIARKPL